jgi:hypothetical protein
LLRRYPDMIMVLGVPLFGLLGVLLIITLTTVFGPRLGKLDLDTVYGPILKRLDRLIAEMEELRA